MPTYNSPEDADNELQRLLLRAVPENDRGNKTTLHLAKMLGVTRWSINKWVRAQKISPERVVQIVELSKIRGYDNDGQPVKGEPRVKRHEFDPYVYKV